MYNVLQEGDDAAKYQESEDWKDFAGPIKAKLVGKRAQIVEPVKKPNSNAYEFKPVLEDGVPVVRPLTEKDINTNRISPPGGAQFTATANWGRHHGRVALRRDQNGRARRHAEP